MISPNNSQTDSPTPPPHKRGPEAGTRVNVPRQDTGPGGLNATGADQLPSRKTPQGETDPDVLAPVTDWEVFTKALDWQQGEHIGMIGPTGSGKTTLALHLLGMRDYITVFATKPRDDVLINLRDTQKYRLMKEWKDYDPVLVPKRLIWPDASSLYSAKHQQAQFRQAMHHIYRQGGWCIYIDELWFIIHQLKLELEIRTFLQQSRSIGVSLVALTQRPAFIPLEVYDQSTHLFFWLDNDERNLKRLSGISWKSAKTVQTLIMNLDRYQVLYVNTRTGEMARVTPPPPDEVKTGRR